MRTNTYNTLIISLLYTFLLVSCVNEDNLLDTSIPSKVEVEGTRITIQALLANLSMNEEDIQTFVDTDLYVEGYVISDDSGGNFFKELIIQNNSGQPTAGLRIVLDQRGLSQFFDRGRKVAVHLEGMSLGFSQGVPTLGRRVEDAIEPWPASLVRKNLVRYPEKNDIQPRIISINEVGPETENQFVELNNVQFDKNYFVDRPWTLANEASDEFNGERDLLQCTNQMGIVVSTSTFSKFKHMELPSGSGRIRGIISKDFFGRFYILKMNEPGDIAMNMPNRCDPVFSSCDPIPRAMRRDTLFHENFETITKEAQLDDLGWININTTGDVKRWEDKKIRNVDNRVLALSAFNSGLNPLRVWLLTPVIDSIESSVAVLNFDVQTTFNNGKTLRAFITRDTVATHRPDTLRWTELDVPIPTKTSNFMRIRDVPVQCYGPSVRIGFFYQGRDPGANSTYHLDNISVLREK